ncbi:MAG: TetR/AcrR family transcriptional regulator [Sphingomonas bacterium]
MAKEKSSTQQRGAARKQPTRERLLDTAGELLAEVGMERISTNMICERAGVTPPALYYYFSDKYDVAAALGERLMERQNVVLFDWLERHAGGGMEVYAEHIGDLLRETAAITRNEPGGIWVERALHSTPRLGHVRVASHRYVTDRLTEAYAPLLPHRPRALVWRRVRMMVEFGYSAIEMLHTESGMSEDAILAETAQMLKLATFDLMA